MPTRTRCQDGAEPLHKWIRCTLQRAREVADANVGRHLHQLYERSTASKYTTSALTFPPFTARESLPSESIDPRDQWLM